MIYSAKAYLEAGDGNLLEAVVALKAGARCAGAEAGAGRDEEWSRAKDSEPRERKIKGTSFPHIPYPV